MENEQSVLEFRKEVEKRSKISPITAISDNIYIGSNCVIGSGYIGEGGLSLEGEDGFPCPSVVIEDNVVIEDDFVFLGDFLGSHVHIGKHTIIFKGTKVESGVKIYGGIVWENLWVRLTPFFQVGSFVGICASGPHQVSFFNPNRLDPAFAKFTYKLSDLRGALSTTKILKEMFVLIYPETMGNLDETMESEIAGNRIFFQDMVSPIRMWFSNYPEAFESHPGNKMTGYRKGI